MITFLNSFKIINFVFLINLFIVSTALSEQIKNIKVNGNDRLADDTIILFSNLNVGDEIDSNIINKSFKNLFDTDYFKDLKIKFNSGLLEITVIENPIIQEIKINGIKNKTILREIEKITRKTEKYPFIESKIMKQRNQLNNIVRMNGFYFAEINTQIVDNLNNSVNLIYNFDLKERAKISEINFVGNKIYNTRKLRKIILSEENRFWKFITKNKYINPNRISADVNLYFRYVLLIPS